MIKFQPNLEFVGSENRQNRITACGVLNTKLKKLREHIFHNLMCFESS